MTKNSSLVAGSTRRADRRLEEKTAPSIDQNVHECVGAIQATNNEGIQ